MKVVYLARSPLAGVCEKMARVVNQYLRDDGFEARVLNTGPGRHRWYCRPPEDLVPRYSIKAKGDVEACLSWADVVHCMANVGIRSPALAPIGDRALRRYLLEKLWVFQWHGAQIWDFRTVWLPEDYDHVRWIHIGQGWIQTQREFFRPFIDNWGLRVLPNVITGDDPLHTPIPWGDRIRRTAYAPSQRKENAVNRKGIPTTLAALRGTKYDLISGASFKECLLRKGRSQLGIDEVVTPMYHLSGLEFLAQGTPCICSTSDETRAVLREATGADRDPWICATPDTLRDVVRRYWDRSDTQREALGREARSWFDEFYHPRLLIEKYAALYEEGL